MGAQDDRFGDGFQPPSHYDPGQLPRRARPVAARSDQVGVGATVQAVEDAVVGAIKEGFEFAREGSQVFRAGEDVTVGFQQVFNTGGLRGPQSDVDVEFPPGAARCRLGHGLRGSGARVPDNQELFHPSSLAWLQA